MNAIVKTPKGKAKPKARRLLPMHLIVRVLIDPATGQKVKAFAPAYKADRAMCAERGYKTGDTLRADLTSPRNPKFNNLVHGLGVLVREQIEGFEACEDAHAAIKKLQFDSGICCDLIETDIPGYGKLLSKKPQSIAFDAMDDAKFSLFWQGICAHLVAKYWPALDADAIEAMIPMMPETPA